MELIYFKKMAPTCDHRLYTQENAYQNTDKQIHLPKLLV